MKRARPIALAMAALLLLASCTSVADSRPSTPQDRSRPNIVFVLTDDLSLNLLSHMPHVQALQRAGTTMSRYYVVDSLCCPSRSSIFTGEYPHDDGVYSNHPPDGGYEAYNANGNEQRAFALSLQRRGYRTGFMGKYLNGYAAPDSVPPGWNEWDVTGNHGYQEFNYNLNENGTSKHYGHSAGDYLTDVLSDKAASFVNSAASDGKPFMLEVASYAPHNPFTPPPRYAHIADRVTYPRTAAYNTLPTDAPSWLRGMKPLGSPAAARIDTNYRKRIGASLAVDDLLGRLTDLLHKRGIADNTDVVFSSDNGFHMGEYRLLPGKQTAFDTDIHVPLIISGPGVPPGATNNQLASNIDLAPTFEALAGASIGTHVDGVSLAPLWHGQRPDPWQRAVLVEHHGPNNFPGDPDAQGLRHGDPTSYEAVRTADALYVRYDDGEQELYNTATDPDELHNIAALGVPAELTSALAGLAACHGSQECQRAAMVARPPPHR